MYKAIATLRLPTHTYLQVFTSYTLSHLVLKKNRMLITLLSKHVWKKRKIIHVKNKSTPRFNGLKVDFLKESISGRTNFTYEHTTNLLIFLWYLILRLPRSPWSNTYEPPLEDGAMPSERVRKLEVDANNAFDQYREMYFEGGVSSVYLWDLEHGFAGRNLGSSQFRRLVYSCL